MTVVDGNLGQNVLFICGNQRVYLCSQFYVCDIKSTRMNGLVDARELFSLKSYVTMKN